MSEAKNPLPTVLVGVVVVFVLVLVGYAGIAKMIEQINPTNTQKLVRSHKCKVAYKVLSKAKKDTTPASAKWAASFLNSADAAQAACLAGKSPAPVRRASASRDKAKAPARRAPEKRVDARPPAPVAPDAAKAAAPTAAPAAKKADRAKPVAPVAKAAPDTRAPAKRDVAAKAAVKGPETKAPAKAPKPLTAEELAAKCKRARQAAFAKACTAQ